MKPGVRTAEQPRDFGPAIRLKARSGPAPRAEVAQRAFRSEPDRQRAIAAAPSPDPMRTVVKEFRLAPGSTSFVHGARVRDPLRKMREACYINARQWNAAEAFRDDAAMATGASLGGSPERADVRTASSCANWPSERQLKALQRVTRTMARFNSRAQTLVVWSLLEHKPLGEWTKAHNLRSEAGARMLRAVLDELSLRHSSQGRAA